MTFPRTFDPEVDVLVRLMNRVEGVYPASSCGGHPNGGKYQSPSGSFFIIIAIKNEEFLAYLKEIAKETIDVMDSEYHPIDLEYNSLHETWMISGSTVFIPELEEFALTWPSQFGEKPADEWVFFKSYTKKGIRL